MTPALAAARPGGNLYRVGRGADAWAWPPWAYAGEDGTFGNRFDDPAGEYRVLYASSPRLGTARHDGPFADIGHSTSLAEIRAALASRLVHYGLDDLDAGDVRRRAPRAFTQEISRYVFEHGVSEEGEPLAGIRYLSRLGDEIENWRSSRAPTHTTSAQRRSPTTTPICWRPWRRSTS